NGLRCLFAPATEYRTVPVAGDYQLPEEVSVSLDRNSHLLLERPAADPANLNLLTRHRTDLDLEAVKVRRKSAEKTHEFTANLNEDHFFLQDGDEVVIPFRKGVSRAAFEDRENHFWITRPGTHTVERIESRENYQPRPLDGLPLARLLAIYYSGNGSLPHPDFDKVRILSSPADNSQAEIVSLTEVPNQIIPWGAEIQIPMLEDSDPSTWSGLTKEQQALLASQSKVTVTVQPEGLAERTVTAVYEFPRNERSITGELIETLHPVSKRPDLTSLFRKEFSGEEAKWDPQRVILKSGDQSWELEAWKVPPLFDGDHLTFFRKL
ncbi:MAG: hypothetical protein KDN20_25995, partial [Verrucomicrobiae bacterium]|nr:hypothetical protein [Verrucomicrobiae bacterium]